MHSFVSSLDEYEKRVSGLLRGGNDRISNNAFETRNYNVVFGASLHLEPIASFSLNRLERVHGKVTVTNASVSEPLTAMLRSSATWDAERLQVSPPAPCRYCWTR